MPQRRKRTTNRQDWHPENMAKAINAYVNEQMPLRQASREIAVARSTLRRRIKIYQRFPDMDLVCQKGMGSRQTIFSPLQEAALVEYLLEQEERLYGLTTQEFRILVWQIAEKNSITHPFRNGIAGRAWMRGFLERNPSLSLRKPESVSMYRASAFNKVIVGNFFDLLQEEMALTGGAAESPRFSPDRIWNVDETSVSVNPKTHAKILSRKGKRQVGKLVSSDRGRHITAELSVSAAGEALPPLFIFPRKRMQQRLLEGASEGTWGRANESGWINSIIFHEWLVNFVEVTKPTEDRPVLLLLDGAIQHTKNLSAIQYARSHFVTLLCFPPHCTHRLQPLDVSVMKPLSSYYTQEINQWMRSHPGCAVTEDKIAPLLSRAFLQAATESNIKNGFRYAGILPFNRDVFSEADYAPAKVTDRPLSETAPPPSEPETQISIEEEIGTVHGDGPTRPPSPFQLFSDCDENESDQGETQESDDENESPSKSESVVHSSRKQTSTPSMQRNPAKRRRQDERSPSTSSLCQPPVTDATSTRPARSTSKEYRSVVLESSEEERDNEDGCQSGGNVTGRSILMELQTRKTLQFEVQPIELLPLPVKEVNQTKKRRGRPRGKTGIG